MQIEINKELVLSTCHATYEEVNLNPFINYSSDENNIRLHVAEVLADFDDKDYRENVYPNLYRLCKLAESLDCKWLVLDADGFVSPDLKVFNW